MTRVETALGSAPAPDGWTLLEGVGAVERAPQPGEDPPSFRRSIVLSADRMRAGDDVAGHVEAQRGMLAAMLPGFFVMEERSTENGARVLIYQIDPPEGDALIQWQAYLSRGEEVAVITATALDADPGDLEDRFEAFVGGFVFRAV